MFWKIYAWIYAVAIATGTLVMIPTMGSWDFASWEGVIEGLLLAIGAFVFAYKKKLFNETAWKVIFIAILFFWVAGIISYTTNVQFLNFLKINVNVLGEHGIGTVLFTIIVSIPALIAIYKMGFGKNPLPISNSNN